MPQILIIRLFNSKGNGRLVKLLAQHGANLDHVNKHGKTPKIMANTIAGFDLTSIEKNDPTL